MKPSICKYSEIEKGLSFSKHKYYVCTHDMVFWAYKCPSNGQDCKYFEADFIKIVKREIKEKN